MPNNALQATPNLLRGLGAPERQRSAFLCGSRFQPRRSLKRRV